MNRELSWLKFNERVLEEAENKKVPLCERLNFAAIYQSNLDEFFMVRVGSLVDQMLLKKDIRDNKTNLTPEEQIKKILAEVGKLNRSRNVVYDEIMEELEEYDICITDFKKMNEKESEYVKRYFQGEIAPIIFPTIVAKRQPFPFLRNLCSRSAGDKERKREAGYHSMQQWYVQTSDRTSRQTRHLYSGRRSDSPLYAGNL